MSSDPPIPRALSLVADLPNQAADDALYLALPHLHPAHQPIALDHLVRRHRSATLGALVGSWSSYDEPLRALVANHMEDLDGGVRVALGPSSVESRLSAIALVEFTNTMRLSYLLAQALRIHCTRTRERCAEVLQSMAASVLNEQRAAHATSTAVVQSAEAPSTSDAEARAKRLRVIVDALANGIASWEIHTQPRVLQAALWLAEWTEPAIHKKLNESKTRIARAISDQLVAARDPRMMGFTLRALAIPEVRPAAVHGLQRVCTPDVLDALVEELPLLKNDEIRKGCVRIRHFEWLDSGVGMLLEMEHDRAARLIGLIGASGIPHDTKIQHLQAIIDGPDERLALVALSHLIHDESDLATQTLRVLAGRGTTIARRAEQELSRRQIALNTPHGKTARHDLHQPSSLQPAPSPARNNNVDEDEEDVNSDEFATEISWDEYWRTFDRLPARTRLEAGRALAKRIDFIAARLEDKLLRGRPDEIARALRIVQILALWNHFSEVIHRLARDQDSYVRSIAISLLAHLPSGSGVRILRQAVNDHDPRVQANAIEALDRLDADQREAVVIPKLSSPNKRVRANAVAALLRLEVREAGQALIEMLEHPSSDHRMSGLWVVDRLHLRSIMNRLNDMGQSDPDERVRNRVNRMLTADAQPITPSARTQSQKLPRPTPAASS